MANVELATAYISLSPTLEGVQGKIADQFGGIARESSRTFGSVFSGTLLGNLGADLLRSAGRAAGQLLGTGFSEAKEAEVANAQLTAAITSTGNAANVSVGELNALATSIQGYSGQTDDSIAATQALLLRFQNIKNVGPNRIFDDTTRAAADMAARLGGDAASQASKLGRALEDPIAGTQLLARSGVVFTDQQKEQIRVLQESGDLLGAQRMVLDQVNAAYGGSAAAYGQTFEGAGQRVRRAFEDVSQAVVGRMLPLLTPALNFAADTLLKLAPAADRVGQAIETGLGKAIDFLGPLFTSLWATVGPLVSQFLELWMAISPLSVIFAAIQPFLPQLLEAFGQLAAVVGGALGQAMAQLAPVLRDVAGVLVKILGRAIEALMPVVLEVIGIVGPLFSTVLSALMPLIVAAAGIFGRLLEAVMPLLVPILGLIAPLAQLVATILPPLIALFVGLLGPILDLISPLLNLLVPVLEVIVGVLAFIVKGVVEAITWFVGLVTGSEAAAKKLDSVWSGVLGFFGDLWTNIVAFFSDGVSNAIGFVTGLPKQILNALGNLGKVLFSAGADLIQGLIDGAGSLLRNIGKFFLDLLPAWIIEPFKAAMGIRSPSTVMRDLGYEIPAGLSLGVDDGRTDVERSIYALTDSAVASSVRSGQATQAALLDDGAAFGGAQFQQTVMVAPEQDPRIVGRQFGREFLREISGDAP